MMVESVKMPEQPWINTIIIAAAVSTGHLRPCTDLSVLPVLRAQRRWIIRWSTLAF